VRQQLCFIDSIIANKASNTGTPEVAPCYLIMGVFGPAVDYLTSRRSASGHELHHTETVINSYLTTFGYTTTDAVWLWCRRWRHSRRRWGRGRGWSSGGSGGSAGPVDREGEWRGTSGAGERALAGTSGSAGAGAVGPVGPEERAAVGRVFGRRG